ncbi:hypothetical protein LCGC14_0297460 [marine sediment metagenome]|uniref:Methyltransferase FkbM domain-containing protein n=1 Tax=marine sediment metagenome TaxID=412755 RepID=A0A0F9WWY2_9ZZZZ
MEQFYKKVLAIFPGLTLNIVDVGARINPGAEANYEPLLRAFPGSKALCFDDGDCASDESHIYKQVILGVRRESRDFYQTKHLMSSSLYEPAVTLPNGTVCSGPDRTFIKILVETVPLDELLDTSGIDLLKLDVQGGELDVLKGATKTLARTGLVVSEAELVPLYKNQPLFGDLCAYLADYGFSFHRLIGMGGFDPATREQLAGDGSLKPHLWADVFFMRTMQWMAQSPRLRPLKLALVATCYSIADFAAAMFRCYDEEHHLDLLPAYRAALARST